jgi:zinc transporter ZupT
MKKNIGNLDKFIRILIAVIIVVLYIAEIVSDILGFVLLFLAGAFILTSFLSFCPLYKLFGLTTRKRKYT